MPPRSSAWPPPFALTLGLVATLTVLRIGSLFLTPLELYPDEAQYWLWSRELAWGYYSKPPVVAWIIAGITTLGGDGEPWIRLGAVLAHAGAPLFLHAAGARLYDGWTGFWAAMLYLLMPGVQLSAAVMTTDAPMLLFLSGAVWAYAVFLKAEGLGTRRTAAALLGLGLGLAFLSKYAALYLALGLALHATLEESARARWTPANLAAAVGCAALIVSPNLLWNAGHGFATVNHTAANAHWADGRLFNPGELLGFLGAQLGVFGILPLLVLGAGLLATAWRRRAAPADLALISLLAPPLAIVAVQAFISRANANWAVAAYPPACVLVAAWLVRRRARLLLGGTFLSQGVVAALFLAATVSPAVTTALGLDNAVKRARGWEAMSRAIVTRAEAGRWTAVSVDDRFLFNALAYYGRDFWSRPGAPPLRMWVRESRPQNQAETEAPLRPGESARVLHAALTPEYEGEAARDFIGWRPLGAVIASLDPERERVANLFEARGWARAARDPATGLPYVRPTRP